MYGNWTPVLGTPSIFPYPTFTGALLRFRHVSVLDVIVFYEHCNRHIVPDVDVDSTNPNRPVLLRCGCVRVIAQATALRSAQRLTLTDPGVQRRAFIITRFQLSRSGTRAGDIKVCVRHNGRLGATTSVAERGRSSSGCGRPGTSGSAVNGLSLGAGRRSTYRCDRLCETKKDNSVS